MHDRYAVFMFICKILLSITIGSDEHASEHFAYEFTRAQNILKKCGFTYYTYFKQRKPEFVKL